MSEKNDEKNTKKNVVFTQFDREILARLPLTKEQLETIFIQLREPSELKELESCQGLATLSRQQSEE